MSIKKTARAAHGFLHILDGIQREYKENTKKAARGARRKILRISDVNTKKYKGNTKKTARGARRSRSPRSPGPAPLRKPGSGLSRAIPDRQPTARASRMLL